MSINFGRVQSRDYFLPKNATGTDEKEEKTEKVVEALPKILRSFISRKIFYLGRNQCICGPFGIATQMVPSSIGERYRRRQWLTGKGRKVVQPRKVTCYPYLFDEAEPGPPYATDEYLLEEGIARLEFQSNESCVRHSRWLLSFQAIQLLLY